MKKFKIKYIESSELKSAEVGGDDILSALEDFKFENHIDRDSIISIKQIV